MIPSQVEIPLSLAQGSASQDKPISLKNQETSVKEKTTLAEYEIDGTVDDTSDCLSSQEDPTSKQSQSLKLTRVSQTTVSVTVNKVTSSPPVAKNVPTAGTKASLNMTSTPHQSTTPRQTTTPKPPRLLQPARRASTPASSQSQTPSVIKRHSVSTASQGNTTLRAEVKPGLMKRSLQDLLSDDDEDDLKLPVTKTAKMTMTSTPKTSTTTAPQHRANASRQESIGASKLSLQDLLSSDEDDELDLLETSSTKAESSHPAIPVEPAAKPESPIALSSDEEGLPDLDSDIEEVNVESQAAILR